MELQSPGYPHPPKNIFLPKAGLPGKRLGARNHRGPATGNISLQRISLCVTSTLPPPRSISSMQIISQRETSLWRINFCRLIRGNAGSTVSASRALALRSPASPDQCLCSICPGDLLPIGLRSTRFRNNSLRGYQPVECRSSVSGLSAYGVLASGVSAYPEPA